MAVPAVAEPVFVLGPLRSGASLLAWSLSLHPRLMAVPDGTSIGRIAAGLCAAVADGPQAQRWPMTLPGSDAVCVALGDALNEVVLRGPAGIEGGAAALGGGATRWCDATPAHALHVLSLLRLFPRLKFIHVARDVRATVGAMVDRQLGKIDAQVLTLPEAEQHWLETTRACLLAERALGADLVLRVQRDELIARPEATLRRCLDFLGEAFDTACLWPLKEYPADEQEVEPPRRRVGRWTPSDEARALSRRLVKGQQWPRLSAWRARNALAAMSQNTDSATGPTRPSGDRREATGALQQLVVSAVPAGTSAIVISRGDPARVALPGRTGWHFPQTDGGVYAGHHPATGADAIAHLEALRGRGAAYLVIPADEAWWLEHYTDFAQHLCDRYPVVAFQEDTGIVIALQEGSAGLARWHVGVRRGLAVEMS
jgi:hypothetical protein